MTCGKTITQTAVAINFLLVLALFFFGTIFSEKMEISQQEKRQLANFPKWSWTLSSLADWPKSLDSYLNDHFFYRESLVFLNALPRVKFLLRSPTSFVLVGEEGWYFLTGDQALDDYLGRSDKTGVETTAVWEKLITFRQQQLQKSGANYLVVVAPNKEPVYSEFLPERIKSNRGTTMLAALKTRMRNSPMVDHFLDLEEPLVNAKETGAIYFKTDSHWTGRGAYFAYRAIIEKINHWYPEVVPLSEDRFDKRPAENPSGGDLVRMMGLVGAIPEKDEERWVMQQPCAEAEDRAVISEILPAEQSLQVNGCPTGIPLRVLVISDSFGDGLRDYLSETFRDVVYSFHLPLPELQGFIGKYRPHIVLDLRVGRHLPMLMTPGPDERI
ncbi:MAG: hypothetical protein V2B20_27830 [Pseudomonadota bacterium]